MKIISHSTHSWAARYASILLLLSWPGIKSAEALQVPTPAEIDALGIPGAITSNLRASAEFRASCLLMRTRKKVRLYWRYAADGKFVYPSAPDAATFQSFATRFTPITADFVQPDKLLVAGLTSSDKVVIEVWKLRLPNVLILANGSLALTTQPQEEIRSVYEACRSERGLVRMMAGRRSFTGHSLVRFTESPHLYDLDWDSGAMVSPTVALSATTEPALADQRYQTLSVSTHGTHGYVYQFRYGEISPPGGDSLYLLDTNRDGVIDTHGTMTFSEALNMGLLDAGQYEEIDGRPVDD